MKITKTSMATMSVLMSVIAILIMAICLQIGGFVAIIALGMWLLLVMVVLIGVVGMLIDPKIKGMDIGITRDENGRGSPNVTAWDEYITEYDNRYKSLALWLAVLLQMILFAIFIHYGYLYAAIIFVTSMILCEAARYRIYKCIKKNKLSWGVASVIVGMQDLHKEIVEDRKTKSTGEGD